MGMAFIARDGSSADARAQMVAQHRSGFCADYDLQAGADFADTEPPPAEACAELGANQPRKRKSLGAYCVVAAVASCCAVVPLLWHLSAKEAPPRPAKPVSLGVWA